MMGERRVMQEALFYGFSLERHIPDDHLLRKIDRFVDLSELRAHLGPYYSETGRPSIDPELMMRMLIVSYCFGIRSERRLCDEVHLNLAYRWFCRLGLDGGVPDHSTFSKNRHGRFRAAGSADETNFGTTGVAAPNAASSSTARYSRTAWFAASGACHSLPGTLRCRLASALIMLASTAKPSPPTSPSVMQRATVASNNSRKRLLSRKRPWRFFEKVEWSGTAPSSSSRQNQR